MARHAIVAHRWSFAFGGVLLLGLLAAVVVTWHRALPPVEPPARSAFDTATIERGARLAAVANCSGCHTLPDGLSYAGGVPVRTPFGTLHGSNLTPDPKTGMGRWSEAAFRRAMHDGLSRDGRHLYPAFPYDHFQHVTDADLHALYAFLMTRDPVDAAAPKNDLRFPFNLRPLVAGWNLLFLDRSSRAVDPSRSAEWNRGAYLVQSLAHCSACHSPRNVLGAEEKRRFLAGGEADGWYAPALNAASPSPVAWDVDHLVAYLRTGVAADHAIAGGPMQGVVGSLAEAPPEDVRAIAVYVASMMGPPRPDRTARQRATAGPLAEQPVRQGPPPVDDVAMLREGEQVYADSCAGCHDAGRRIASSGALPLPLAVAVHDPDPRSLIRIVREGIVPPDGARGRWMPPFAGSLTDEQTTALLAYLRRQAAEAPPWPDLARQVQEARQR